MITVIGEVEVTVDMRMKLPKARETAESGARETAPEAETGKGSGQSELDKAYEAAYAASRAQYEEFWQGGPSPEGYSDRSKGQSAPIDEITVSHSGCGYSIAKHLACMGNEVAFVSVVGKDPLGMSAIAELAFWGQEDFTLSHKNESPVKPINVSGIRKVDGQTTVKVQYRNIIGDIEFIKTNDSLAGEITPDVIKEAEEIISASDAIVIDGALSRETIEYIVETYGDKTSESGDKIKIFFDPASLEGGAKVGPVAGEELGIKELGRFCGIMPGRKEAEAMCGKTVLGMDQLEEAGAWFGGKGVKNVIITMKGGGIYYRESQTGNSGIVKPARVLSFGDTAGAGDLTSAVIVNALMSGHSLPEATEFAVKAADGFLAQVDDERPY